MVTILQLPNVINGLWQTYLSTYELLYLEGEEGWKKIPEDEVCKVAAEFNFFDLLKWAYKRKYFWDWRTSSNAASTGNIKLLQYAYRYGCEMDRWTCTSAAEKGHLDILKWTQKRTWKLNKKCDWDEMTCAHAAKGGHLEVLKWLVEKGCPWDKYTIYYAVSNSHLNIVIWIMNNGLKNKLKLDEEVCKIAIRCNQKEILDWLNENDCPCKKKYHQSESCKNTNLIEKIRNYGDNHNDNHHEPNKINVKSGFKRLAKRLRLK